MGEVGDGDGVGDEGLADLDHGDVHDEGGDCKYDDHDYEDLPIVPWMVMLKMNVVTANMTMIMREGLKKDD